jgi:hypothetical protein
MIGAELFRVSLSWPALVAAAALAASPALAAGLVPPKPGDRYQRCFDPEAVVLGAKPHRDAATAVRRGGAPAPAPSADDPPILTLVLERPRDCGTPLDWDSVSTSPRPGMFDGEPSDGVGVPFRLEPATAAQGGGSGGIAPPARASASLPDPVIPDGAPAAGFAVGGGFAPPHSPVHGLAERGLSGAAPLPPSAGLALTAPRGGASPTNLPPDAPATTGDLPAGSTAPAPADRIAAIPEPSTWALLVLGLFGLGATLRRRPSRSALTPA